MRVEIAERKCIEQALHQAKNELELKVAEGTAELRKSERELRQLIDAIPQQVFVFDVDWGPVFANRRELEYTGLTSQEMKSKDAVARVFRPEDLKKLEAARERARSDGAPFAMEARIRRKDGGYRWFLIRDNPLRDEQGLVLRWYGTRTDIEDRKRAEEALLSVARERLRSEQVKRAGAEKLRAQEKSAFEPSRIRCLNLLPKSGQDASGASPLCVNPSVTDRRS